MERPLLKKKAEAAADYSAVGSFEEALWVFWRETVKLWRIVAPVAFTTLFQYMLQSVTAIFAGHLGDFELSAISLSITVIAGFPFAFMHGMATALGTLCGQAYGAGHIANLAGKYSLQIIPSIFTLALGLPIMRFLQAQGKVTGIALISFVALIVHIGLLYLLIDVFGWGTTGAAVAYDTTYWGIAISLVVYVMVWCREEWTGFSSSAFKDVWGFAKLSLASCMMFCLESWYTMIISILAGLQQNAVVAVGSFSICMNFQNWELMLMIGINAAISIRVSNELGMGCSRAAKYSVCVAVLESVLVGILCMIAIFVGRDYFAMVFTASEDMLRATARLAYFLGANMLLCSATRVLSGVAVGGGWQMMVAYINFGCYYLFGLPLAILLCFKANLGVMGLWGGMMSGTGLQILLLLIVTSRTNWDTEVEQTTKRIKKWGTQAETKSGKKIAGIHI